MKNTEIIDGLESLRMCLEGFDAEDFEYYDNIIEEAQRLLESDKSDK
tara:strand:- start:2124 stop:2264 length:141 start_codon:yes stop_codon:yes gene_type:complete